MFSVGHWVSAMLRCPQGRKGTQGLPIPLWPWTHSPPNGGFLLVTVSLEAINLPASLGAISVLTLSTTKETDKIWSSLSMGWMVKVSHYVIDMGTCVTDQLGTYG